jgi:hypothetical protein
VKTYQGRSYAEGPVVRRQVTTPELVETVEECCGTAHGYRNGELRLVACIASPGSDPVLACGRPGPDQAPLVRSTARGTTCDAIENALPHSDVDLETCTLSPTRL